MEIPTNITHFSEGIVTEILTRLPLRSLSRFKSVCKTWKSTLESAYFRRLFISLHKNSSSSWSLMTLRNTELIGFHRCKTWDLQKPLASYMPKSYNISNFSNGLVLIEGFGDAYYVGNPILQQWVKILPPFDSLICHLVTRVDEDGVVLSFKVVSLGSWQMSNDHIFLGFSVYSSETGIWIFKQIHCPDNMIAIHDFIMTLNGMIYLSCPSEFGLFLAHDFCSEFENQFRIVHYPDQPGDNNMDVKEILTTSGGFIMYIRTLAQNEETSFKVWRLNNDEYWQLLWDLVVPIINNCIPMAMHPFDSGIVYLWNLQNRHLESCNLATRRCKILRDGYFNDHQDCFINQTVCDQYIDDVHGSRSFRIDGASFEVLQFVLPWWMESVPCPPHVEMINTTSLLSAITSKD